MVPFDHAAMMLPVSDDKPAGPDLQMAEDRAFLSFLTEWEGALPEKFLEFDPKRVEFERAFEEGRALLARTKDVRVLVILIKLAVLRGDLVGFCDWVDLAAKLLASGLPVHPADDELMAATLQALDDSPTVVMPLQHAPIAESPRVGRLSLRTHIVSAGDAPARPGEPVFRPADLDRTLDESELSRLMTVQSALERLRAGLASIAATRRGTREISFGQVAPVVERLRRVVVAATARRSHASVPMPSPAEATAVMAPAGATSRESRIGSRAEAETALRSALAYFRQQEPSSPAVLLIGQACELVGRNLFDVVRTLLPAQSAAARVNLGKGLPVLPVSVLGQGPDRDADPTEVAGVESRVDALSLLGEVSYFYRAREPSSPIPTLVDRAKALTSSSFEELLKELFPEEVASVKGKA